ncbi:Imidazole glycerol phosphate synthase amidotransferase subunit [Prochlorococcus sp. MIT 0601]|nr:Imidazole glycerol phosphate synthase amidotransferase subunit [Prochlorococcus sp. MIT 0601]
MHTGIGNIGSIKNALEFINYDCDVINSYEKVIFKNYSGFILPGVGAFKSGMESIKNKGLDRLVFEMIDNCVPGIGVCLGMQVMAEWSIEGGEKTKGLGIFKGGIVNLRKSDDTVPHIGWTYTKGQLDYQPWHNNLNGEFYYIHSYALSSQNNEEVAASFKHGNKDYVAAVYKSRILGVQFHPEKSQHFGLKLIDSFFSYFTN